jgi:multiple sugar transport system permease protein
MATFEIRHGERVSPVTSAVVSKNQGKPLRPARPKKKLNPERVMRRAITKTLIAMPLVALFVWTIAPFFVTVVSSLQTRGEVFSNPGILPANPNWGAYQDVLATPTFWSSLGNSLIVGAGTTILTIVLAVPAAYAFARFNFRGRSLLLLFTLLPRLVPNLALMVPLYRLAIETGMLDKIVTLVLVYTGMTLPLAVFLLVGFYRKIPLELEEAASVDGAVMWQRLWYVVMPLSIPALITIAVLAFREAWNEFTLVLVLMTSASNRTLPFELYSYQGAEGIPNYPAQAALALITVIPFVLVYMRIEKYVVSGITAGSGK